MEVKKRLVEVGRIIGIDASNHIIVADEVFTLLKEKGDI